MVVAVATSLQPALQRVRQCRAVRCAAAAAGAPQKQRGSSSAPSRSTAQPRRGGRRGGGGGGGSGGERVEVESAPSWRVFEVAVPVEADPGKDDFDVHAPLLAALARKLGIRGGSSDGSPPIAADAVCIVRKSFDARSVQRSGEATG